MANLGTGGQNRAAALLRGETVSAFAAPFSIGLGLSSSDGGLTGEPSGSGYARQAFTFTGSGNAMSNANAITFGPFTASLGVARAFAIFDSAGNVLWHGPLNNQITLGSGESRSFVIGAITATVD